MVERASGKDLSLKFTDAGNTLSIATGKLEVV